MSENDLLFVVKTEQQAILRMRDVRFRYNKRAEILKGANLDVYPGEIIGISGENGAGKSTLLKLIIGLLKPNGGTIEREGRLGYSPQSLLLFENLTVRENFRVFGRGQGLTNSQIDEQAERIMELLKFRQYGDTMVKNLSGGTAQKLNFGISLLGDPDILVLDEPYQGLDYASFLAFWDIQFELRERGKAVLIVSHLIEDQSKFSRSLHLVNGRLQSCNRIDCPECCGDGK